MNEIYIVQMLRLLESINRSLIRIASGTGSAAPAVSGEFYLIEDGRKRRWDMALRVKADAPPKKFRVEFKDSMGNPAAIDGDPKVSLMNADLGVAEVRDLKPVEGLLGVYEGVLAFLGKTGVTKIQMDVDGDTDPSVEARFMVESEDVEVIGANAVVGTISFLAD